MTAFDPTVNPANEVLTANVVIDDINSNLDRIQAKFVEVANCLTALDPTGPSGPVDPDTGNMTGIPLKFKTFVDEDGNTQIVQANISSTTAFQQSLNGLTIEAGEAVIASTSNANAFGTSVGRGDALFAKVNNPTQDITNTTDWLRLEGDDSYSVTLSERQFLDTLNEDDVPVRAVDASTETTVTFYLLSTAATVDGDLTGGQVGSFRQTTDQRNGILYVRMPSNYVPNTGEENLYVEVTNTDGTNSTFITLDTYTERTDLLVAGDDVYESAGYSHGTSINYSAGQVIKLWRTRLSREWYFNAAFDVLRGLPNNSIPINKLTPTVQGLIRDHPSIDLTSIESQLLVLHPLGVDVNILTDWADIYSPAQVSETVRIVDEYSLLADFRGTTATDHYESAGVTYTDGTDVIDYSGLTDASDRSFGFEVSGASNLTTVSLGNGGSVIPFFRVTSGGNVEVNNYTPARTGTEVVSNHFVPSTLNTGTGTLTPGGAASTYTIPFYPANTDEQSRTISLEFDVLVGGTDSGAGGGPTAAEGLTIPNDDTAEAKRTIDHTFFLGWPSGRSVTVTIGYEYRKVGPDFLIDLTLETAPSDISLRVNNVTTFQSYTATAVIARVDNWLTFQGPGGDFTFSGEHEFLFEIAPIANDPNGRLEIIGAAISAGGTITEFNNITISNPPDGFDEIQIPDTIEFRTFKTNHYLTHSRIANYLRNRSVKWVYELARLEVVTGHAITEAVDLATGSTLNGVPIKAGDATDVVHQATAVGTGAGELIQNLVLPADYTDYTYLHVTEVRTSETPDEWRTVLIDIAVLSGGDISSGDLLRIQGNSDFTWTIGSRTLTSQAGQTVYRAVLLDL